MRSSFASRSARTSWCVGTCLCTMPSMTGCMGGSSHGGVDVSCIIGLQEHVGRRAHDLAHRLRHVVENLLDGVQLVGAQLRVGAVDGRDLLLAELLEGD